MSKQISELLRVTIIPSFKRPAHKGAHGKVLILGGSYEYTGAPYYAGISSLKVGGDLVFVACASDAGVPLKAYSPELIVHPVLPSSKAAPAAGGCPSCGRGATGLSESAAASHAKSVSDGVTAVSSLLDRADSVVIGPGLGRDPLTLEVIARVIEVTARRRVPTVIDGDGLFLLAQSPGLVAGHPYVIITPNAVEFKRLWDATSASASASGAAGSAGGATVSASTLALSSGSTLGSAGGGSPSPDYRPGNGSGTGAHATGSSGGGDPHDHTAEVIELSRRLGGVVVLRKGTRDVIAVAVAAATTGSSSSSSSSSSGVNEGASSPPIPTALALAVVADPSSPRRCGGQGDVLAGALGTFLAWAARARLIGPARPSSGSPASAADALVACGYGAALLTRTAASYAFESGRRSTTTPDIIGRIGTAFEDAFQDARS